MLKKIISLRLIQLIKKQIKKKKKKVISVHWLDEFHKRNRKKLNRLTDKGIKNGTKVVE